MSRRRPIHHPDQQPLGLAAPKARPVSEVREEILRLVRERSPVPTREIVDGIGISRQAVLKHLKRLRKRSLVTLEGTSKRDYVWRSVAPGTLGYVAEVQPPEELPARPRETAVVLSPHGDSVVPREVMAAMLAIGQAGGEVSGVFRLAMLAWPGCVPMARDARARELLARLVSVGALEPIREDGKETGAYRLTETARVYVPVTGCRT